MVQAPPHPARCSHVLMSDNSRVRVSIVGVVIVALFGALVARLWFLQIGADGELRVEAVTRSTRVVQTENARGRILDRLGNELVRNKVSWVVSVDRSLEDDERMLVLGRLAEVLGEPHTTEKLEENFNDVRQSPLKPAIVAVDVPEAARIAILEHIDDYPGTEVERVTVREYPNGPVASHLLGYVGEVSAEQLETRRDDGYQEGESIGRAGVERAYEHELRGEPRRETVEVDPRGRVVESIDVEPGSIGDDVYLTIDLDWQVAAEESLRQGIEQARTQQNRDVGTHFERYRAPAGAVVALDVTDGSVVAMASYPSYDPTLFVDGISQVEWAFLNDDEMHHKPLLNRSTQGQYAPGSTFKLVTSVALTRYGVRTPGTWINDPGYLRVGNREFKNFNRQRHGRVNLQRAITVSSDVYFYSAGYELWQRWEAGGADGLAIQDIARELGFGVPTGFELDEADGTIADPDWKRTTSYAINETEAAKEENARWYPGDNVNVSVGQGGMTVTPLQLANAYATFANGGTLWRPHLGGEVRSPSGELVRTVEPETLRTIDIDPAVWGAMHAGFEGAVRSREGTARGAFAGFPFDEVPVAGKTGTAEVNGKGDTSLFAAYFPANDPQYVVVAVVEEAGQGARVAAPIVRRVVEAMSRLDQTDVEVNEQGSD